MPETRSSARASAAPTGSVPPTATSMPGVTKRKAISAAASTTPHAKRSKSSSVQFSARESSTVTTRQVPLDRQEEEPLVPAILSFSFEDAKTHLINVDSRFAELFARLRCKPFEYLEQVHPFRCVAKCRGQQISWVAARSINHRFIRLYDPSLPEKPEDYFHIKSHTSFFPTPYQVASTEIATLKTAGLSTRKAEYVKDLAARFADGRLSTSKLLDAEDRELAEMLIEVRGIGRWTVDMFALFTLRRPNVLPVGDLGVQRGMLRWFGRTSFGIKPEKGEVDEDARKSAAVPRDQAQTKDRRQTGKKRGNVPGPATPMGPPLTTPARTQAVDIEDEYKAGVADEANTLPTFVSSGVSKGETHLMDSAIPEDISSVPPSSLLQTPHPSASAITSTTCEEFLPIPSLPQPFTPSVNKVIEGGNSKNGNLTPWTKPLPDGLTQATLKSRLDGKKVKGAFLAPQEMEALAQEWVPYRSVAVYYMWALAEEK
ncbi:hypothetical protein PAXRUDRAFT_137018 [Paxillus rubicundulus Ve08.2h10]|uniref:HhH-GPD domain-containing protein n=1 Tax=Paxillus rubicundulus Ve08.2h10 TaxID=930991 RepID=A0A0D0EB38_9AGAM|nr:hypothetical protein PAXRUDRAFT_137018 [Paxillus rubicundulus Ve08.2h10]